MRLLELAHCMLGIGTVVAIGCQRLPVATAMAGLDQLGLQGLDLGTALAGCQHAVGHRRCRRTLAALAALAGLRFTEHLLVIRPGKPRGCG